MHDIQSRDDVTSLVRTFYDNLFKIPGMKEVFRGLDFEEHIPRIVHFWSFVLLDESGYKTNVFDKHLRLPLQAAQFDQWRDAFVATVNQLFAGPVAETAKQRATVLAYTFKSKWEALGKG